MKTIKIVHLYPKEMNIYGDNGNVLVLYKRLKWLGFNPEIVCVGVGDELPADTSVIIGGGGQDAGQLDIAEDLKSKRSTLSSMANNGVTMLMICGMYQMFGKYFKTFDGKEIPGLGIMDIVTIAGNQRIIGNITIKSKWGDIVGYENHSGKTYLGPNVKPLGEAKKDQGNNGQDNTEGAVFNNVFATYLHGPILSKNVDFTDYLIQKIIGNEAMSKNDFLKKIDNLSEKAAEIARQLKR